MPYDAAIPEMWHAALEEAYRNKHVYAGLCNRNYEGEIRKQGDVVRILTMSDPTRRTYTKNTTITAPEVLSIADQTLVIDQAFYINSHWSENYLFAWPEVKNVQVKVPGPVNSNRFVRDVWLAK